MLVVMDKTGTLTNGTFEVSGAYPAEGIDEEYLISRAAAAETYSTHPIARVIREYASGLELPADISDASETAGHGVKVSCPEGILLAGNGKLMDAEGIEYVPSDMSGTIVYCAADGKYIGCIRISDTVKDSAPDALRMLTSQGVRCVMLTGDSENRHIIMMKNGRSGWQM